MIVKGKSYLSINIYIPNSKEGEKDINVYKNGIVFNSDIDLDKFTSELSVLVDASIHRPFTISDPPFGSKWKNELMKWRKSDLVNFLRDVLKKP